MPTHKYTDAWILFKCSISIYFLFLLYFFYIVNKFSVTGMHKVHESELSGNEDSLKQILDSNKLRYLDLFGSNDLPSTLGLQQFKSGTTLRLVSAMRIVFKLWRPLRYGLMVAFCLSLHGCEGGCDHSADRLNFGFDTAKQSWWWCSHGTRSCIYRHGMN